MIIFISRVDYRPRDLYASNEVSQIIGISRNTLYRWIKEGIVNEAESRDRRGWKLFTQDEINQLKKEANILNTNNTK